MGKRKPGRDNTETLQDVLDRPWCYYCNRDFNDQRILVEHMKAKHFKCDCNCNRRLTTAGGLRIHMAQVHKQTLTKIANALPERDSGYPEIFAMEGIPEELIKQRADLITREYYKMSADKRIASGAEAANGADQPAAKKPKYKEETAEERKARVQARLAEVIARREAEKAAAEAGVDVNTILATTKVPTSAIAAEDNGTPNSIDTGTPGSTNGENMTPEPTAGTPNTDKPKDDAVREGPATHTLPPTGHNAAHSLPVHPQQQPFAQNPYPHAAMPSNPYMQHTPAYPMPPYQPYPGQPYNQYVPGSQPYLPGFPPPMPYHHSPVNSYPPGLPQPAHSPNPVPAPPQPARPNIPGLPPRPSDAKFDADLAAMLNQAEQVAKSDEYRAKVEAQQQHHPSARASLPPPPTTASPLPPKPVVEASPPSTTPSRQSEDAVQLNRAAAAAGARRYAVHQGKTLGPWTAVLPAAATTAADPGASWEENRARVARYRVAEESTVATVGAPTDAVSGPVAEELEQT